MSKCHASAPAADSQILSAYPMLPFKEFPFNLPCGFRKMCGNFFHLKHLKKHSLVIRLTGKNPFEMA